MQTKRLKRAGEWGRFLTRWVRLRLGEFQPGEFGSDKVSNEEKKKIEKETFNNKLKKNPEISDYYFITDRLS